MKELIFLAASSVVIIICLLFVGQAEKKESEITELETRLSQEVELRRQSEENNEVTATENRELKQMLYNRKNMLAVQTLSRGDRDNIVTMPSGFTSNTFEYIFAKIAPGMVGTGKYFIEAENKYGINSVVLAAICILESGGGTSQIAKEKNNLAGLGAYDYSPYKSAMQFDSCNDCIMFLAELLSTRYKDYSLISIGKKYASDKKWAGKVNTIITKIIEGGL